METNLAILEKKAIDAALKNEWEKALELNTQILKKKPNDINTKIRLGKAQIQTKNFKEAAKTFKSVLEVDPINQIALKNLQIAKEGKVSKNKLQSKKLIKEPGTTTETQIINKRKSLNLEAGDILELHILKGTVSVLKDKKEIGLIEDKDVVKALNKAKGEKAKLEASFIKQKNERMTILLSSSISVFKSERQDIKPYFKKGTIEDEEPELELGMEITEE